MEVQERARPPRLTRTHLSGRPLYISGQGATFRSAAERCTLEVVDKLLHRKKGPNEVTSLNENTLRIN